MGGREQGVGRGVAWRGVARRLNEWGGAGVSERNQQARQGPRARLMVSKTLLTSHLPSTSTSWVVAGRSFSATVSTVRGPYVHVPCTAGEGTTHV